MFNYKNNDLSPIDIDHILVESDESIYTEKKEKDFVYYLDSATANIRKIFEELRAFALKFISDMKVTIKRIGLPAKLNMMKKNLAKQKDNGKSTVKMIDYKKFTRVYNADSEKISSKIKSFNFRKYKNKYDLNKALDSLESEINDWNKKLSDIMKNKIDMPIKDAIKIVENEIKGKSDTWSRYMRLCNQMEKTLIDLNKKLRVGRHLSNSYIEIRYHNKIQRCGTSLLKYMRKHAADITRVAVVAIG